MKAFYTLLILLVPFMAICQPSIMDVVAESEAHTFLAVAIDAAGLNETLDTGGPFTLFAPTNEAFTALEEAQPGIIDALLADTETLTSLLLYHVANGTTMAEDLNDGDLIPTLNNASLTVSIDGMTCMIDMATVTVGNIEVSNGVVHVIDMVLLTSSFIDASWFCGLDGCEESMDNSGDYSSYEECFEQGCTVNTGEDCSELFISEYVEGSSNNKAIEIYNPTQFSKDLSNYKLVRYANGSGNTDGSSGSDEMTLSGSLNPYSTFVITNSDTNTTNEFGYIDIELYNMADQIAPSYPSPLYFNGNDAIGLTKNGILIDLIGKIGEDPGDAWTDDVDAGFIDNNNNFGTWWTKNHTLVRKGSVKKGVSSNPVLFDPTAEWDSLPNNTFTELGFHECECSLICEDVTTYIDTTVCDNFNWNGGSFSQSGSDSYTYLYVIGDNCDSTVTVNFTINQSSYSNLYIDNCESFEWNGDIYSESGTYTYLTTNTVGCDSISTLNLNIYNEINENNIIGNPNPDPYTVYTYSVNENGNLFDWSVAGGSIIENNGNFISIQWGEQGEGLITLTEFNDACESYINELNVTIGNDILNSWNCVNDACVDPMDGTGFYDDINECEAVCDVVIAESWNCLNDACVDPLDGSGEYGSLNDCEANCSVVIEDSWNCLNDACVDPMDGSGEYGSLNDCEANCTIVIEDSWNCLNDACVDPLDGSGVYSSLNDCEQECQNVSSINENLIDVNIYPNPSSNIFNIEFNSDSEAEIAVTNILGEQVYFESTKSIGEFNTQIDLSNYSKGIYNLTIKTSDRISNHKLILQ